MDEGRGVMRSAAAKPGSFPKTSIVHRVALGDLRNASTQSGLQYWQSQRGERPFPRREEIEPRAIIRLINNVAIIKVIDGGADYEYRIAGDALVRAYRPQISNRRLSEIAEEAPLIVERFREAYQAVVNAGEPLAVQAYVGHDHPEVCFVELESIILPLGAEGVVDHLMTVSVFSYT